MTGKIKGTGSYIPVQVWDNDKLSHMMDTSDEWIRGRTGIGQRHIASGEETVSYMAAKAGEAALADAKMKPEEIDLILVSTMSAEIIMPCAACEVQKLLGAVHATCFDLNGACTGFLLALNTAQAYLGGRIYRTALVIGAEALSHLTNWQDRSTCVLFGDGAGAVVLEADPSAVYVQAAQPGSTGQVLRFHRQPLQNRNRGDCHTHQRHLYRHAARLFGRTVGLAGTNHLCPAGR